MIHRLKFIFFVIYFSDCTRQGLTATPQKAIGTYQMMENNMKTQRMDLCKTGNAANSLMIKQMKAVLQAL